MHKFPALALALNVIALQCFGAAAQSDRVQYPTLSTRLIALQISPEGWDEMLLAQRICSDALADEKKAIAYSTIDEGDPPAVELHIARLDASTRRWIDRTIDCSAEAFTNVNRGSINSLHIDDHAAYVSTHVNPSLNVTLVLDTQLNPIDTIHGWPMGIFGDGAVLYQKGQIHFARVHPLELGIYNPKTAINRIIYPPATPGPVRNAFSEELQKAFKAVPEEWFATNNYPADPQRFSEYLRDAHVADSNGGAIVFESVYVGKQLRLVDEDEHRELDVAIVGIYRNVTSRDAIEYREFRKHDLEIKIPFEDLQELTAPETIDAIFKLPYP